MSKGVEGSTGAGVTSGWILLLHLVRSTMVVAVTKETLNNGTSSSQSNHVVAAVTRENDIPRIPYLEERSYPSCGTGREG
jgi:hypothetical protein